MRTRLGIDVDALRTEITHLQGDDDGEEEDEHQSDGEAEGDDDDTRGLYEDNEKKYLSHRVTHGSHLVQGNMGHGMENYIVAKSKKLNGDQLGLYAIFDGHCRKTNFRADLESMIRRAYEATDNDILENVSGARGDLTAVTTILINGRKLVVANVGDSRAVLSKNGNVPRVDGELAMTREFGDGRLKDHISAELDVSIETIDENTEFIILASDGLWKVIMSSAS
ncbi:hypothetical protein RJ640_022600 [Escallonia rubra]|uniref:PPM-type phosphatase domain-containing protein n=1 Tax=Escallonia rubra TaxID=112253 RepID=A0AA88UID3_9ASTE|nr:hypothetical protein RJ640_022600 [Escallonia rubra]